MNLHQGIGSFCQAPELLTQPWQEVTTCVFHVLIPDARLVWLNRWPGPWSAMGCPVTMQPAASEPGFGRLPKTAQEARKSLNRFAQLGLGNAFTSAVWELLQMPSTRSGTGRLNFFLVIRSEWHRRNRPAAHYQDVQAKLALLSFGTCLAMAHFEDYVVREFESHLDKTLLTKAEIGDITTWRDMDRHLVASEGVWDAIALTFHDEAIRAKAPTPRERERGIKGGVWEAHGGAVAGGRCHISTEGQMV